MLQFVVDKLKQPKEKFKCISFNDLIWLAIMNDNPRFQSSRRPTWDKIIYGNIEYYIQWLKVKDNFNEYDIEICGTLLGGISTMTTKKKYFVSKHNTIGLHTIVEA